MLVYLFSFHFTLFYFCYFIYYYLLIYLLSCIFITRGNLNFTLHNTQTPGLLFDGRMRTKILNLFFLESSDHDIGTIE